VKFSSAGSVIRCFVRARPSAIAALKTASSFSRGMTNSRRKRSYFSGAAAGAGERPIHPIENALEVFLSVRGCDGVVERHRLLVE
jgi:hypothetical protein